MARKTLCSTFVEQVRRQLGHLREAEHGYRWLQLYVSGVSGPWEFSAGDEFEFHEDTGVLIIRDGGAEPGEDVPQYVFRLEAIVAAQLV